MGYHHTTIGCRSENCGTFLFLKANDTDMVETAFMPSCNFIFHNVSRRHECHLYHVCVCAQICGICERIL